VSHVPRLLLAAAAVAVLLGAAACGSTDPDAGSAGPTEGVETTSLPPEPSATGDPAAPGPLEDLPLAPTAPSGESGELSTAPWQRLGVLAGREVAIEYTGTCVVTDHVEVVETGADVTLTVWLRDTSGGQMCAQALQIFRVRVPLAEPLRDRRLVVGR
jgi:hypothetical protein